MIFASVFWLLGLIPIIILIILNRKKNNIPTIKHSNIAIFKKIQNKSTKRLSKISNILKYLILILIVITLARPQLVDKENQIQSEGIDIMMIMDTSGSMAAEDLKPKNRLEVAKQTMKEFISLRNHDRIGLVVFGTDAYTQVPLTNDYKIIGNFFDDITLSMAGDGTSIGMAIATGLNRLKDSKSKSKIIVLITDGENNSGEIEPIRAAELAKELNIKIYTIGIGQEGGAPIPFIHPVFGKVYSDTLTYLDEVTLKKIASLTNGTYFRATDKKSLQNIYTEIDKLEKTKIISNTYVQTHDLFPHLLKLICILIFIELIFFNFIFIVTPWLLKI